LTAKYAMTGSCPAIRNCQTRAGALVGLAGHADRREHADDQSQGDQRHRDRNGCAPFPEHAGPHARYRTGPSARRAELIRA
jgi:hypothetical protein